MVGLCFIVIVNDFKLKEKYIFFKGFKSVYVYYIFNLK